MDVEPPTGDDLNRMLVSMKQDVLRRAAAEPPARRRPWARRHLGLTLGLVALLGVGGAGGALALVLPSPFQASPAATPTSTPSATPTSRPTPTATAAPVVPAQPAAPSVALGVDCATLGERIGVTSIGLSATPDGPGTLYFTTEQAAERQAGVSTCGWSGPGTGGGQAARLELTVAPAGDRGREWISGLRQSGLADYGIGDASAFTCDLSLVSGCNTTFVVGSWWVETTNWDLQTADSYETDPELLVPVANALADLLAGTTPGATWSPPATSWSETTCDDLAAADVGAAVGTQEMGSARDQTYRDSGRGIRQTQLDDLVCAWNARTEAGLPDTVGTDQVQLVYLHVAPGSGWAYGTETEDGDTVTVRGAESATWACAVDTYEQDFCQLDLLVDGTWLRMSAVTGNGDVGRERVGSLISAAEAVLAAQAAASGRG